MPPFGAKHADNTELTTVPRRWVRRRRRRNAVRKALKKYAKRNNLVLPSYRNYARRTRVFIRGDFVGDYNPYVQTRLLSVVFSPNLGYREIREVIQLEKDRMAPPSRPINTNNHRNGPSHNNPNANDDNVTNNRRRVRPITFPLNLLRSHRD